MFEFIDGWIYQIKNSITKPQTLKKILIEIEWYEGKYDQLKQLEELKLEWITH